MKLKLEVLAFLLLTTFTISAQDKTIYSLGTNLPPIMGNTYTLSAELIPSKQFTTNFEIGIMLDSKLQGSMTKIGTGRSEHINSGKYLSAGIRFTPREQQNQTHFFVGMKILGGYFEQSAKIDDSLETYYRDGVILSDYKIEGDKTYSDGYFFGLAGDIGMNVKIANRFNLELGIQGGQHLYTSKRQVDNKFSYLPGMGALNFVGIARTKILIGKLNNSTYK